MLLEKSFSNLWIVKSFFLRQILDLQFRSICNELTNFPPHTKSILDVGSGRQPWNRLLPRDAQLETVDVHYSATYDSVENIPQDKLYDLILVLEVLEHVERPRELLNTLFRHLRPRGEVWISTPFVARVHPAPHDFCRWTPEGLEDLCQRPDHTVTVSPRGSDIVSFCVLGSLLCFTRFLRLRSILWGLVLAPFVPLFVGIGHLALACGFGGSDTPLGYFVRVRPSRSDTR
jgi:hypothetical protein